MGVSCYLAFRQPSCSCDKYLLSLPSASIQAYNQCPLLCYHRDPSSADLLRERRFPTF